MSALIADIVMVVHLLLIIGVLLGILVSVRYKRFRPVETIILLGSIVIWSLYSGCPLTYLEATLRERAGNPIALTEVGFIPYYAHDWFGLMITRTQLTIATYLTAIIFFAVSIEWMSPFLNMEIMKLRKILRGK